MSRLSMGTSDIDEKIHFAPLRESIIHEPGRLLQRDFVFHQTSGVYNITKRKLETGSQIYFADWYHSLVHQKLYLLFLLAVVVYLFTIVLFALAFDNLGKSCQTEIVFFMDALFLSMETLFTIGYGTPDPFFGQCEGAFVLITVQSILGTLLNGTLISLLFMRLSSGAKRSVTILFSDKAVVRRVRGQPYFLFQVVELRKHQLASAKISCYAIRHARGEDGCRYPFQYTSLRLQHPDDSLASPVLLFVPAVVVHRIDNWSALMPPCPLPRMSPATYDPQVRGIYPDVFQRAIDADVGNRNGAVCGVCGSSFNSTRQLAHHMRYCQVNDAISGHERLPNAQSTMPVCDGTVRSSVNHLDGLTAGIGKRAEPNRAGHYWLPTTAVEGGEPLMPTNQEFANYWTDCNLEVLVLLEGNDITSSFPVQARHSYYFKAGEILFDQMFDHCLQANENGGCEVDFTQFHKTHPVSTDSFELDGVSSQP